MRVYERFREWTPAEVEFLKNNREMSHGEVAEELPLRSEKAVRYAREKYGFEFSGSRSRANRVKQIARGADIKDKRGPNVRHIHGSGSPCLRCWNSNGSKSRYGCLKCDERSAYDDETSCGYGVLLRESNDNHALGHSLGEQFNRNHRPQV